MQFSEFILVFVIVSKEPSNYSNYSFFFDISEDKTKQY